MRQGGVETVQRGDVCELDPAVQCGVVALGNRQQEGPLGLELEEPERLGQCDAAQLLGVLRAKAKGRGRSPSPPSPFSP